MRDCVIVLGTAVLPTTSPYLLSTSALPQARHWHGPTPLFGTIHRVPRVYWSYGFAFSSSIEGLSRNRYMVPICEVRATVGRYTGSTALSGHSRLGASRL